MVPPLYKTAPKASIQSRRVNVDVPDLAALSLADPRKSRQAPLRMGNEGLCPLKPALALWMATLKPEFRPFSPPRYMLILTVSLLWLQEG